MAFQKIFSVIFAIVAVFCVLSQAATIPEKDVPTAREGRFYGMGGANAQASAVASASGLGGGYGGYPGYGMGGGNAFAAANANAGSFGYGK